MEAKDQKNSYHLEEGRSTSGRPILKALASKMACFRKMYGHDLETVVPLFKDFEPQA